MVSVRLGLPTTAHRKSSARGTGKRATAVDFALCPTFCECFTDSRAKKVRRAPFAPQTGLPACRTEFYFVAYACASASPARCEKSRSCFVQPCAEHTRLTTTSATKGRKIAIKGRGKTYLYGNSVPPSLQSDKLKKGTQKPRKGESAVYCV